jgi:predicted phage terminase large subunit-like protein
MYTKIVIGVDPAVTSGSKSDETGIVVVGKGSDGMAYVLDDLSYKGTPAQWAQRVIDAYHHYKAHYVVAEVNQGGDLVETLLRTTDPTIRFKAVRATKSKQSRAAPIAMLYEQGKVFHTRAFPELEQQMCTFIPDSGKSPDRIDALVWALTELMKHPKNQRSLKCWEMNDRIT